MGEHADEIWCAASAPVVQSLLVGLGIAAIGLALFPFTTELVRPRGAQYEYRRATTALRVGRRISWLLPLLVTATLAGYVVIYVRADGKFCDAALGPVARIFVVGWGAVTVVTFLVLALMAALRSRANRAGR